MATRKKPLPKKPTGHTACPCGEVPTDLIVRLNRGAKHGFAVLFGHLGEVSGNCCGYWSLEFRAGYPKSEAEALLIATKAWNDAPRGKS